MAQPARCPECRKWIHEKRAETASKNRHALISVTIDEQRLSYQDPWVRDPGGRTGAITAKKNDPKQIPRIQSKLDAIMRPIPTNRH